MPQETASIEQKLSALEAKLDQVMASVEKTRRYTFWSLMIPLALLVLPLLAVPLVVPFFMTYLSTLSLSATGL